MSNTDKIMDTRIAIWNTLHDGEITVVSEVGIGLVTMFVNIPYLRSRINPIGDSFILKLAGVKSIKFIGWDGVAKSLKEEMSLAEIEISHTDSEEMPITVKTTMGDLISILILTYPTPPLTPSK